MVIINFYFPPAVIINRMRTNKRWLVSSLALAVFPSLPVIEKDANNPILL